MTRATLASYFPSEPGLYAIRFPTGIKIGKARNLAARVATYCGPWNQEIVNFYFIKTNSINKAEQIAINLCRLKWPRSPDSKEFFETKAFDSVCATLDRAIRRAEAMDKGSND